MTTEGKYAKDLSEFLLFLQETDGLGKGDEGEGVNLLKLLQETTEGVEPLLTHILRAARELRVNEDLLIVFCLNTPENAKGQKLLEVFEDQRTIANNSRRIYTLRGYTFADLLVEVLIEVGEDIPNSMMEFLHEARTPTTWWRKFFSWIRSLF